jgi:hypothetical protein
VAIPTFTNPRLEATFQDWPLGGSKRGPCTFVVEKHPKRGSRILRTTTGKPKASTYSDLCAIVDGSDGRTYLLHYSTAYGECVSIYSSDNAHNAHFEGESGGGHYHNKDYSPLFGALAALVKQANGVG